MFTKNLSLKRINKDIIEITKSPIEGIGIVSLNNNPMEYIVNMKLMAGIYEGYCLQLLLTFSDNYPIYPPKILIYPGQPFDNTYHHHIYQDSKKDEYDGYFNKFCFDLLENDFLSTSTEYSGWNPSYTISSLLIQVQSFLCDPDMNEEHLPDKNKINDLMNSMKDYKRIFIVNDGKGDTIKVHTWNNPYPQIYFKNNNIKTETEKYNCYYTNKLKDKNEEENKIIKENLTCFISRQNYIDDKILIGYPIKNYDKNSVPIPEIISYDSYIEELLKNQNNNDYQFRNNNTFSDFFIFPTHLFDNNNNNNFFMFSEDRKSTNNSFKSANNEYYNNWLPIYINEEHYIKNKTAILNSFSIIKYGNEGLKEYDFIPEHIFEILPNMLSEMIIKMAYNKTYISSSFIRCFFQYIILYKKLIQEFNYDYRQYIYNYLYDILNDYRTKDENRIKKVLEMFVLSIFNEIFPNKKNIERYKYIFNKIKNLFCLELFDNNDLFKMKNPKQFINDLFKYNLFYKIVDIILLDEDYLYVNDLKMNENTRNKIKKNILKDFKEFYKNLGIDLKSEINKIIIKNLDFIKYFDLKEICSLLINDKNEIYPSINIFSIFNILKEKINEDYFLDDLEQNYGIFIEVDDFIKEIIDNNINFLGLIIHNNQQLYLNQMILLQTFKKAKIKRYYNFSFGFDCYYKIFKHKYYNQNDKKQFYDNNLQIIFDNIKNYKDEIEDSIRYNRSYRKLKEKFGEDKNLKKKDKYKYKYIQKERRQKEYHNNNKNIMLIRNKYKNNYR